MHIAHKIKVCHTNLEGKLSISGSTWKWKISRNVMWHTLQGLSIMYYLNQIPTCACSRNTRTCFHVFISLKTVLWTSKGEKTPSPWLMFDCSCSNRPQFKIQVEGKVSLDYVRVSPYLELDRRFANVVSKYTNTLWNTPRATTPLHTVPENPELWCAGGISQSLWTFQNTFPLIRACPGRNLWPASEFSHYGKTRTQPCTRC